MYICTLTPIRNNLYQYLIYTHAKKEDNQHSAALLQISTFYRHENVVITKISCMTATFTNAYVSCGMRCNCSCSSCNVAAGK